MKEYCVMMNEANTPDTHKAMRMQIGCVVFTKRADALRWQLHNGMRRDTVIVQMNCGNVTQDIGGV